MVQSHFPLFPCCSILILLCYLTISNGHPLKLWVAGRKSENFKLPLLTEKLAPQDLRDVLATENLKIRSWFSRKDVVSTVEKLPVYMQGTSDGSYVFNTTWPRKGVTTWRPWKGGLRRKGVRSIAKGIIQSTNLQAEIDALQKVGQLVDVGYSLSTSNSKIWWIVMEDLTADPHYLAAIHIIIARRKQTQKMKQADCTQLFTKASNIAQEEMKRLVGVKGLLHADGNMMNILYDHAVTRGVFIDWEYYHKVTKWDDSDSSKCKNELNHLVRSFNVQSDHWCGDFPSNFDEIVDWEKSHEAKRNTSTLAHRFRRLKS